MLVGFHRHCPTSDLNQIVRPFPCPFDSPGWGGGITSEVRPDQRSSSDKRLLLPSPGFSDLS